MGVTAEGMTIEVARELVSNQLLWPLVRAFLWDFAPSIHASWLDGLQVPGLVHDFVRSEVQRPNPSPRVKRYILDSLGVEPKMEMLPMQAGDVYATYASIEKLHKAVGYEPKTTIREGIPIFAKWYREYYGG